MFYCCQLFEIDSSINQYRWRLSKNLCRALTAQSYQDSHGGHTQIFGGTKPTFWTPCMMMDEKGGLNLPDGLPLPQVIQAEEYIRVLPDAVVREAFQVDQKVVWYRNATRFPVALLVVVTLERKNISLKLFDSFNYLFRMYDRFSTVLCFYFVNSCRVY